MFTTRQLKSMSEGVRLFNEQKYWECHEALEEIWLEERQDPARNIYWAVIQVAASCIHYRDGKIIGAQGMIMKSKEKFRRCREFNLVNEDVKKFLSWEELEDIVMRIPDGTASVLGDFKDLFEFRFRNYNEDEII